MTMVRFLCGMLILAGGTAGLSAQTFLGKDVDAWRRQLSSAVLQERRSAAFALGKLGNGGAPALAALKKALVEEKEATVREAVAFALGEIGRDSLLAGRDAELVPVLARGLKDVDPLVRRSTPMPWVVWPKVRTPPCPPWPRRSRIPPRGCGKMRPGPWENWGGRPCPPCVGLCRMAMRWCSAMPPPR